MHLPSPVRFAAVALAVSAASALAQTPVAPSVPAPPIAPAPPPATKLVADLGYVQTSGNTDVTTLNLGEKLTHTLGRFSFLQGFGLVYGKQRDTVNNNALRAGVRSDYKIDKTFALFVGVDFERNTFAGIARHLSEQLGVQARVIGTERDTVRLESGGTVEQKLGVDHIQQNFPAARAAGTWRHAFTHTAFFNQNVEFIPNVRDSRDWRLNTESAVISPISTRIGLKISYVIRVDNLPEPGFSDMDRLFTSGIQASF